MDEGGHIVTVRLSNQGVARVFVLWHRLAGVGRVTLGIDWRHLPQSGDRAVLCCQACVRTDRHGADGRVTVGEEFIHRDTEGPDIRGQVELTVDQTLWGIPGTGGQERGHACQCKFKMKSL